MLDLSTPGKGQLNLCQAFAATGLSYCQDLWIKIFYLGSTVKRGFWAVDGMMVQVGGLRLAADSVTA